MNKKLFQLWFSKLGKAWEGKDPQAVPLLFADKFKYYETPFEKPHTTKKELLKLWEEVPASQKDIEFDYDVITITNNIAIAHWHAGFTRIRQNKKAVLDGIFLVELNNKGLATLFKQWWVTKE
ncbi:nuclear transport factor 2 family protein [Candidatus Microgenomates bacterium]|nr:nuclear transport factor 2 family protein [Candidatus Microgenomates bacterium]